LLKRWISSRKFAQPTLACPGDHGSHLGATGVHRAELLECGVGASGDDSRERGLAASGRAMEDHRMRLALLDRPTKRRAVTEQVLLSDEFVERGRSHPRCQRRRV
jgi:hypothetical protein